MLTNFLATLGDDNVMLVAVFRKVLPRNAVIT